MSSSKTTCAACKYLRRKCLKDCVFAPYFPPDNLQKFIAVHKVYGACNVGKLLNELDPTQREDAVNSLVYEAEYRLRDPVYGCPGAISILQHKLKAVQQDIENAKKELSMYLGPNAFLPMVHPQGFTQQGYGLQPLAPYNSQPMMGLHGPTGVSPHSQQLIIVEQNQQNNQRQLFETQQFAAREQETMRNFERQQQQQQQNDLMRYNVNNATFDESGFDQLQGANLQPSLALGGGSYEGQHHYQNITQPENSNPNPNPNQQEIQIQQHELMQQQQQHKIQMQQYELMQQQQQQQIQMQQHELMQQQQQQQIQMQEHELMQQQQHQQIQMQQHQQQQQQQQILAQQYVSNSEQQLHRDSKRDDGNGRSISPLCLNNQLVKTLLHV